MLQREVYLFTLFLSQGLLFRNDSGIRICNGGRSNPPRRPAQRGIRSRTWMRRVVRLVPTSLSGIGVGDEHEFVSTTDEPSCWWDRPRNER